MNGAGPAFAQRPPSMDGVLTAPAERSPSTLHSLDLGSAEFLIVSGQRICVALGSVVPLAGHSFHGQPEPMLTFRYQDTGESAVIARREVQGFGPIELPDA